MRSTRIPQLIASAKHLRPDPGPAVVANSVDELTSQTDLFDAPSHIPAQPDP